MKIFNKWYDQYSDAEGKMTRLTCGRFVRNVTNSQEEITENDYRVKFLFENYDIYKQNYLPREGFISFYVDSLKRPDKKYTVWENLHNMGIRNDLRSIDEGLNLNTALTNDSFPRYKLANNQEFFDEIFSLLNFNNNDKIAKEAFNFLNIICTNPKIFKNIFRFHKGPINLEGAEELDRKIAIETILDKNNTFKLVYNLQIIKSLIEDLEIETQGVESIAENDYLEKEEENDLVKHSSTYTNIQAIAQGYLNPKKIEWMKNFINSKGLDYILSVRNKIFYKLKFIIS